MKNIIVFFTLIFLSAISVYAAQNKIGTTSTGSNGIESGKEMKQQTQQQLMISPVATSNQVQNKNQIQTQNQGDDQQLRIQTEEQEQTKASQGGSINSQNINNNSEEHMSAVAKKVQELQLIHEEGGIGEQVRQIAKEQIAAQEQIKLDTDKLNSRSTLKKLLFGTDYKAIKNLKSQLAANQLRITQLEELKVQLVNTEDIIMIQSTIEALIQQNTTLQNQIDSEESTKSMFGWIFRFFMK